MERSNVWAIAAPALLAVMILAGIGGGPVWAARWGENYFPNFPVVTHEGKTLRFYDDLIRGKMVVINFAYTNCTDICGLASARMARVREWLGDEVGKKIFIYTITLDPGNDKPEVLKKYAEAFGAGDGWQFVTGEPDQIHTIRWKLGERSRYLAEHRSDMVIGNDATGFWRRISLMGNLKVLTEQIRQMDPAWRDHKRTVSRESVTKTKQDYVVGDRQGEALYLKACSYCHTVGVGDRIGPDLLDVSKRRDHDWLVRFLIAPDEVLASGDPAAAALDVQFGQVNMPNLGLSKADAEDLIVYLETETERVHEAQSEEFEDGHDHHHNDDDGHAHVH